MSASGRRVLLGLLLCALALLTAVGLLGYPRPRSDTATDAPSPATESTGRPTDSAATASSPSVLTTSTTVDVDATLDLSEIRSLPPAAEIPKPPTRTPRPIAVRIAAIGVTDGRIVPVGVDGNGEYEVPAVTDVGWYKFGPVPGDEGSTVLAAHIAYDGAPGVFQDLASVEPGAVVEVVMSDATTVRYEIHRVEDYLKTDLPTDSLFDESGPDRLVLITCGGAFNPELRSYESNTVAYATRVS